ncbi:c-type cytochrome [Acetobacter malorum]|uniref:c-type cytochrome n=1 Tax=Acetobacter malorum TaxID=178901 RepID=UPI0039ED1604
MVSFKKSLAGAAGVVGVIAAGFVSYKVMVPEGTGPAVPVSGLPAGFSADPVKRGEYLTRAADCEVCHTEQGGGTPFAGGRAFQLPFGTIYATNLTPDKETGIGNWTDEQFIRAVRNGVGSHGNLYPAMSYTSYTQLSTEDVLAIKTYLFSLQPVHHTPQPNSLSFPFNQRWGMTFWNLAFFHPRRFQPDTAKGDEWNRGAYLATALGHCGECHTPRNIGFAMRSHDYLAGTEVQGWKAYNTTSDTTYGIGGWSEAQLEGYLSRGHAEGRSSASGPMAEVVEHSLQHLSPSDIHALMVYLRSTEPETGADKHAVTLRSDGVQASNALLPGGDAAADNARGKRLFEGDCAGCHQFNGAGRQTEYASLAGSHAVNDPSGTSLVQVILNGTTLTVGGRKQFMPGFGGAYSDTDVAAVANYVLAHFGSKTGTVTAKAVHSARQASE